jgi:hypothetical protein
VFLFLVQEIKYEKILPTFDGEDLKSSQEFYFVIPPSLDYFTRYFLLFVVFFFFLFLPINDLN